jgi:hypothetical protein
MLVLIGNNKAARRRVLSLWDAERVPIVRGLRAGQDSSSESGDKGAVLALDIVTNSHNLGDWFLIETSLLRKVWLATPVLEEVMRAGPLIGAVRVPHGSAYLLTKGRPE